MNAGAYRERIVIERGRVDGDGIGNRVQAWEEYYRCHAYMNNLSGKEYWEAAQVQSQDTVIFILRYHRMLEALDSKQYRIRGRRGIYDIIAVDNVQYKNEQIKIRAVRKG